MRLIISFSDQSPSFAHGVEFGRILAKMEAGQEVVGNYGFPVRSENSQVITDACRQYGYLPLFRKSSVDGWVEFTATKTEKAN